MKNLVLFSMMLSSVFTCIAQSKSDIVKEINDYVKSTVNVATYDKKQSEVFSAISIIASEEYNTIVRESESKGYIEAKQESDTQRETINIEIRGEAAPYRVSFQVKKEQRTKNLDNTYTNWGAGWTVSDSYMTKLKLKLYTLLNGPLELSKELQIKVDNFNSKQDKDRKKIVKGKDY